MSSGVRARAFLGVRDEGRVRCVLRAQRRERLDVELEQLADRELSLLVRAFAVVVVNETRTAVEEVARRPARVFVVAPELELRVDQHRVADAQALDGRPDRRL